MMLNVRPLKLTVAWGSVLQCLDVLSPCMFAYIHTVCASRAAWEVKGLDGGELFDCFMCTIRPLLELWLDTITSANCDS